MLTRASNGSVCAAAKALSEIVELNVRLGAIPDLAMTYRTTPMNTGNGALRSLTDNSIFVMVVRDLFW